MSNIYNSENMVAMLKPKSNSELCAIKLAHINYDEHTNGHLLFCVATDIIASRSKAEYTRN